MKKAADTTCPISKVVDILGDSCSILIIRDLLEGPRRFGELEDSLKTSTRTLSIKLKHLEKEGLVLRKALRGKPARVEYRITHKGAAFQKVEDAMRAYGKKYL